MLSKDTGELQSILLSILLSEREVSTYLICSPNICAYFSLGFFSQMKLPSRSVWLHSETGEVEKEDAALAPLSYFLRARIKSELVYRLLPQHFTLVEDLCLTLFSKIYQYQKIMVA